MTPRVLFVGMGSSSSCYYRCALPAMALGHDWIGVAREPPKLVYVTGLVDADTQIAAFDSYDVIVIQQARAGWRKMIDGLHERGVKVVIEIDDYIKGIAKVRGHDWAEFFEPHHIKAMELNMRLADAVIVSTPFLERKYRAFNRNVWLCQNGLDLGRYQLTRPSRETCTIGWAGGTGHVQAMEPWLAAIAQVLHNRPETRFVTIGEPFAGALSEMFPGRCLALPFTPIETYPCAMTLFDVAIAPAARGLFARGKSDLRFLEAGALGIPMVADPAIYPTLVDGATGLHASTPEEAYEQMMRLVDDAQLRSRLGDAAAQWVVEHRGIRTVAAQWETALGAIAGS